MREIRGLNRAKVEASNRIYKWLGKKIDSFSFSSNF